MIENRRPSVAGAAVIVLVFIGALAFAGFLMYDGEKPEQDDLLVEINAKLDKISKSQCPDVSFAGVYERLDEISGDLNVLLATDVAERASEPVCYQDFRFDSIEIIYLPDCLLEEEPTADHPIVFICSEESDYLGKLLALTIDELKRVEYEMQEGGVMFWVHFPQ